MNESILELAEQAKDGEYSLVIIVRDGTPTIEFREFVTCD